MQRIYMVSNEIYDVLYKGLTNGILTEWKIVAQYGKECFL